MSLEIHGFHSYVVCIVTLQTSYMHVLIYKGENTSFATSEIEFVEMRCDNDNDNDDKK